jgi:hypothetical protein
MDDFFLNEDDFDTMMTLQQSIDNEIDNYQTGVASAMKDVPDDQAYEFTFGPSILYGRLDYDSASFMVKGVSGTESPTIAEKLIKGAIGDIEKNHPTMDAIVWEVGKNNFELVEFLTKKCLFVIHETSTFSFTMVYHLQNILAPKALYSGGGTDGY